MTSANNLEWVSYSSIRQGATEERDNLRVIQRFMIQQLAEPVFREWLSMGITKGVLPFPANFYDKFAENAVFKGRGWSPLILQKKSMLG